MFLVLGVRGFGIVMNLEFHRDVPSGFRDSQFRFPQDVSSGFAWIHRLGSIEVRVVRVGDVVERNTMKRFLVL